MLDYFKLYKTCLSVIYKENPSNGNEFLKFMNDKEFIISEISKGMSPEFLTEATLEALDNLIDDGLVKASKSSNKDFSIYTFKGLTTMGYQYLTSMEDDKFVNKLKNELKEQGVPTTTSNITKFIARLFL